MKIALIHTTVNSMEPINNTFKRLYPEVDLMNFLDEGLMYDINRLKKINTLMQERIISMLKKAENSGAKGILLACSAFSPYVETFREFVNVPVLSADVAMLEESLRYGENIKVLTTIEAAKTTTTKLLNEIAASNDKEISVDANVVENAFAEIKSGNKEKHDSLICADIEKNDGKFDVIILAQMSMTRAYENSGQNYKTPVLTSPEISAKEIIKIIEKRGAK